MTESHLDYHLKRAENEEYLASMAADPATVRSHRDLARLHRMRAEEMRPRQARPQLTH